MSDLASAVRLLDHSIRIVTDRSVRYVASVRFKSYRPTSDFTEAQQFEREEAEWWAANLNAWFNGADFQVIK